MKLLNKTVRSYILYSAILLLIAIPVFYFVIGRLVQAEIDEVLLSHKKDFTEAAVNFKNLDEIEHYPLLNEEFFITPVQQLITTDSFYTERILRPGDIEIIPFRVVKTGMTIQGKPYELLVKESLLESEDLITTIIVTQIALIAALFTGLILINRGLTRNIWKPFDQILSSLKQYDLEKNKQINFQKSQIDEFEELRLVVQQLLFKNQQAYISQKEFTQNASHEIQTPLAVVNAKLDLLMQTDAITSEQAGLIVQIADSTHHLSQLNRSLLMLAKIENDQFGDIVSLNLTALIQKHADRLLDLAQERQLAIQLRLEDFNLDADPTRIEILFSNLLSNAVRHSSLSGTIEVELADGFLSISNPGGPLQEPERIFERFKRDVSGSSGSGLGLALVSKICESNGYAVAYSYRETRHWFEVNFQPEKSKKPKE